MYVVVVMANNMGQDVQDVHGLFATEAEATAKLEELKREDQMELDRHGEGEPEESDLYGEVVELTTDHQPMVLKRRRGGSKLEQSESQNAPKFYTDDADRSRRGIDPLGDLWLVQTVKKAKFEELWPEMELHHVIDAVKEMPEAQREILVEELQRLGLMTVGRAV